MVIGVPREIKPGEQRVAATPAGVHALVEAGHRVLVEQDAGNGSGFRDEEYAKVGASLGPVDEVWSAAEMILKVKEPIAEEYAATARRPDPVHVPPPRRRARPRRGPARRRRHRDRLRDGAARRRQPATADADERGRRTPGRAGGRITSAKAHGGRGILLSGVPGVPPRQRGDPRRRYGRSQRRPHRHRARCRRLDPRRQPRPPAPRGRALSGPGRHAGLERLQRRAGQPARRSPGRRRAGGGRARAGAGDARDGRGR